MAQCRCIRRRETVSGGDGTPQGGSISSLLANIYLHYVFDLWALQWRNRCAHGDVVFVRYADDFVVGFEKKTNADNFLMEIKPYYGDVACECW